MTRETQVPTSPRLPGIDILRGVALLAMASYHFTWDLRLFDLIATDPLASPALVWYARVIAASFLMLAGVSLVLAHGRGLRRAAFLRRLATVVAAAVTVTLATWLAFPDGFIFFGILHHIALASVLALPLLRLPVVAPLMAAAVCFSLPSLLTHGAFDAPWLLWLGLSRHIPATNDYVPVFPWFGWVLIGVALGRLAMSPSPARTLLAKGPGTGLGRSLGWLGRHSLGFYLVHQPVLLGLVWLGVQSVLVSPVADVDFRGSCAQACQASGEAVPFCARMCACVGDHLRGSPILATRRGPLSESELAMLDQSIAACRRVP
jgi:uncharacterized membrane protein